MIHCLDIGGSFIKAGLLMPGAPGEVRLTGRAPTPTVDFEAFADQIAAMTVRSGADATAVSISITGVIDPDGGVVTCANIPCIDGRALGADLAARLGLPVSIANDADCFVLAEAVAGAGRGHRVVFGAILGTGVGGGIVVDGALLQGHGGLTGEWGHGPIVARQAGQPPVAIERFACGCGQEGCVDTIGGARGLERLHRALHGQALPSHAIIAAWDAGDADAARTVAIQVDLIAEPLALVVNLLGPSIVPVGGGMASVPRLIDLIDQAVRRRILRRTEQPLVVPGQIRVEPGLVGAGILGARRRAT